MSRTLVGDAPLPSPPCSLPSLFVLENLVPASQMSGPTLYGWGLVAHAEEGLQRGHVASPADLTHAVTSTTCIPIPWAIERAPLQSPARCLPGKITREHWRGVRVRASLSRGVHSI